LPDAYATEGVSASKPFGSFSMNFKGVVDSSVFNQPAGTEIELMKGSLKTVENSGSKPQFSFINVGGDALTGGSSGNSFAEAANVILDDASGTGGIALTQNLETEQGTSENSTYAIAFDDSFLLRGKDIDNDNVSDGADVCKSRTLYDSQVWRYNLYHTVDGTFNGKAVLGGDRVELNSGFPFTYDSNNDGTEDVYGWIGYHGIWADGSALADGETIVRYDYTTETSTNYTVNISPGKMIRRSASSLPLSDFVGDEFQFWGEHPVSGVFGQWIVVVQSDNTFDITGLMDWGDSGPTISTSYDDDQNDSTPDVTVVGTLNLGNNDNVWLWSDALGGNISYVNDGAFFVKFYKEEFVAPNDSTLFSSGTSSQDLYCYERCLKGGLSQNDVDAASSADDLYYTYDGVNPLRYTLSVNAGKVLLTDNSNGDATVSAVGLVLDNLGYNWGINTGEMLTSPLANPGNPWEVFDAIVSYRWETGNNEWNQMVTVSDPNGVVATFDKPMQFTYTHITANDANADTTYNDSKFLLNYSGPGELYGFPWIENSETNRWSAAVTLKDAALLDDGSNNMFAVKSIELEQSMQTNNTGGCTNAGLDVSTLYTNTSLTLPTADSISAISFRELQE